jgi:hypothetical protein
LTPKNVNLKRKRNIDSTSNKDQLHAIYRERFERFKVAESKLEETFNGIKQKVGDNNKRIDLYVEVLFVTERSVYFDHQIFANTTNKDLVFLHIRMYLAHLFHAVN